MTKSVLIGIMLFPNLEKEIAEDRPALATDIQKAKRQIQIIAVGMVLGLISAIILYFGPLANLNPEALRKGDEMLQPCQSKAIWLLIAIATVFVAADVYVTIKRQSVSDIIAAESN